MISQQAEQIDRLQRKTDELLRRLTGFTGSAEQAAKMVLPSLQQIETAAEQLEMEDDRLASAKSKLEQLFAEKDQTDQRLRHEQLSGTLPTLRELEQARLRRNKSVDQLSDAVSKGSVTSQMVNELRSQTLLADQLADTIRMHGEAVHRRAADQAKLNLLEEQIAKQQLAVEASMEDSTDAQDRWHGIWQDVGVVADTPARMQRWIADHEQLVECFLQLQSETKRLHRLEDEVADLSRRLREAVAKTMHEPVALVAGVHETPAGAATETDADRPLGSAEHAGESRRPPGGGLFDREESLEDFSRVFEEAVRMQRRLLDTKTRYDRLCQTRDTLKEELPAAQTRAEAARKQTQQWDENWQKATAAFVDATDRRPEVVVSMLSKIDALCEQRKERNILATRIRSIGEDDDAYRESVLRVAKVIGWDTTELRRGDGEVSLVVQNLFSRLQQERTKSNHHESLVKHLEETKHEMDQVVHQLDELEGMLARLCREAGCEQVSELIEIERRAEQRRQRQTAIEAMEDQLRILAAGTKLSEFVESTLGRDAGVLDVEIDKLDSLQRELNERIATTNQDVGSVRRDLQQIDGGAQAAELRQSIQFLAGQISKFSQQYAQTKIASMILAEAIEHYRRENQGPVLGYAQDFFRRLTCDEYETLRVDHDGDGKPVLLGVRRGEAPDVHTNDMSTGTADSLYLSLRLASLKHQISHGLTMPLIVDDCLIQLDDRRAAAALGVLSQLSTQTQIILFTHHDHLLDLASKHLNDSEYHIHRLADPTAISA